MHMNQCNFNQAVTWINDRLGESATLTATTYHTKEIIRSETLKQFVKPVENSSHWDKVRAT
jgi:hypothetical protein